jgi:DNA repair protein RecO (recombination protein O)
LVFPAEVTQALVLRFVDFGESDRIVHLLTPDRGRVAAMAKGARRSRKRFPGTLDLFNQLDVQLDPRRRQGLARLEAARLVRAFQGPRTDADRFALGCYVLELLDRAAPEGGRRADLERLFNFAVGALSHLDEEPASRKLLVIFELRALDALGFRPELSHCVRCGAEITADSAPRFHVGEGGPVDRACQQPADAAVPIGLGTLRSLLRALERPLDDLRNFALRGELLEEAHQVVRRFHRFHLGFELRSERFVDRLA